jgi:hypothetical protein
MEMAGAYGSKKCECGNDAPEFQVRVGGEFTYTIYGTIPTSVQCSMRTMCWTLSAAPSFYMVRFHGGIPKPPEPGDSGYYNS